MLNLFSMKIIRFYLLIILIFLLTSIKLLSDELILVCEFVIKETVTKGSKTKTINKEKAGLLELRKEYFVIDLKNQKLKETSYFFNTEKDSDIDDIKIYNHDEMILMRYEKKSSMLGNSKYKLSVSKITGQLKVFEGYSSSEDKLQYAVNKLYDCKKRNNLKLF